MLKVPRQVVNELKEARERVRKARSATMPGIGKVQLVMKAIKCSFVDKEGISKNLPAFDGCISRQDFRINVAQNHVGGTRVVPGEQARPDLGFIVQQWAQIDGRKVPEVENLHGTPRSAPRPDRAT